MHKKVYPVTVKGMPAEEVNDIQSEAEKVSEESKVHDPVCKKRSISTHPKRGYPFTFLISSS